MLRNCDLFISLCLCRLTMGSVSYKEKDFLANLTWNYDPKIRPVLDGSNTTVSISMGLYSLLSLDEKQEVLSFKAWVSMLWKDQLLVWNTTDDIPFAVTMPLPDVWTPTVLNVDSVTSLKYLKDETDTVFVYQDGTVAYSYVGRFDTGCKVNIQQFPFDHQTCTFHLQILYTQVTKEYLEVTSTNVVLDVYRENGEFNLLSASMVLQEFTTLGVTQPWIEVTFVLKRRTTFYILNNILPVVFLSFLNCFVFCLPGESGEKMSLCVSILLSYAMFLTLINSYLPANSDHLCFFSVYVTLLVLISTLTCLVTIFMLALHTYLQTGKACPRWLPVAWRSDSKVGTSEPWVKKEDIAPNQSDVNGKANNKSEMKDLIIAKCHRVAFGTFFTLTLLINLIFFISVSP
ncbi:neuronal acetylcholine receptor subunit alpha-3-like [Haliotis rubra]|uniref:neuronal acetylcholine receptor subunit alpha-3-like n=1 Tax=Haliotis rubra TaxID=36100 RepID=UPI001EE57C9D|nr:neuronal acetylcholine receptor subunit alpha-3-like [Haliotis rubra]